MCVSTQHAGGGSSQPAAGSSPRPSAANASPRVTPSGSRRSASSSSSMPHTARLPKQPRPNRDPSSIRKATAASVRGAPPASPIASSASTAASTPSAPSKRPPSGGVSRWEPLHTSASAASLPGSRPYRLPAGSTLTWRPASSIQPATMSKARCSPAASPGRFVPAARSIANRASSRSRIRAARMARVCQRPSFRRRPYRVLPGRDYRRPHRTGAGRSLPRRRAGGARRHVRGLSRLGRPARPARRDQGADPQPGGRRRRRQADGARGTGRRQPPASQCGRRLRPRRGGRRHAVPGDGVDRGPLAQGRRRGRAVARAGSAADHAAAAGRARARARARHRPPGHQAAERPDRRPTAWPS